MKTVYIVPGFTDNTKQKRYKEVITLFKKRGFEVVEANLTWEIKKHKYHTMTEFVNEFLKKYKPKKGSYVFGFSFGAMISFICASKIKPKMLILCSLSPYFIEELEKTKAVFGENLDKYFGKKFYNDLKKYSFNKIVKKIKCKTILLVGDKEDFYKGKNRNVMTPLSKKAHKEIKNSKLIIVKDAKHNIADPTYKKALRKVISKF